MSSNSVSKTIPNRLPAPALFVGPPSHNASATSLLQPSSAAEKPSRVPLSRQRSLLSSDAKRPAPPTTTSNDGEALALTSSNPSAPFVRRQKQANEAADAEASSRAEAIWAEMQNTLEEVELSAIKGPGMTVFGSEHSRALEDLRQAQIELAKAWARSEAEEEGRFSEEQTVGGDVQAADLLGGAEHTMEKLDGGKGAAGADGIGGAFERSKLEEETEKDIELSRKRREANDRYFEKVNKGVLEVVNKLEEVAKAMKSVEHESKEIWRDGESEDASSLTTVPSIT